MKKRTIIICILTIALTGCTSSNLETTEKAITGDYVFSQDSKYSGKPVKILAEGNDLFIEMEGLKTELKPDGQNFRFTTGDMVWNRDKTAKIQEWFLIAYDSEKEQYYLGSPDNSQWRQYLIRKQK
ncbi:MAG: hypothetical protein K9M75_01810 [Phycisphaerae bacterium]|nr:hypothetical protein [Phycisphaerae bacterium]